MATLLFFEAETHLPVLEGQRTSQNLALAALQLSRTSPTWTVDAPDNGLWSCMCCTTNKTFFGMNAL